jgi:cysteinyl-tRNA synthetase
VEITSKTPALDATPYHQRFIKAMDDDFNTPQALAALFDLATAINKAADTGTDLAKAQETLLALAKDVLGLTFKRVDARIKVPTATIEVSGIPPDIHTTSINEDIIQLVTQRDELRKTKNWAEADKIRDKLSQMGITVEDTPSGPVIIVSSKP